MKAKKISLLELKNLLGFEGEEKKESLFSFFDGKDITKINVKMIKDFFDYQMKYLGVDGLDGGLFYQDFKIIEDKTNDSEEKKLKQKMFDIYKNTLLFNLEQRKKSTVGLSPFTSNTVFISFLKRALDRFDKKEQVIISIQGDDYEIGTKEYIEKELEKEMYTQIHKLSIELCKEAYQVQKKAFKMITKLYHEANGNKDDEEGEKVKKTRKKKELNGLGDIFQGNVHSALSRLTFEFNEVFVPEKIEKIEKKEIDYTSYYDDEDEEEGFTVRSNEHQMLIRYFLSMIDGLYGSKTIYVFATEKELKEMNTFDKYKKFKNKSTRQTKFSFIVSDKMYLLSNTYLYLMFDILQNLGYGDSDYNKYINEVKMILIEKTDVSKLTLIELKVLLNQSFYKGFGNKLFLNSKGLYTGEEKKEINDLLEKISGQSDVGIDDEYEFDLYETKRENTKNFITKNLEKFNLEMGLGNSHNSLYNFFLYVIRFNKECGEALGNATLNNVKSQVEKIKSKQHFFEKYLGKK